MVSRFKQPPKKKKKKIVLNLAPYFVLAQNVLSKNILAKLHIVPSNYLKFNSVI